MHNENWINDMLEYNKHHIYNVNMEISKYESLNPTILNRSELNSLYKYRNFCYGWRFPIYFSDGKTRFIDLLATVYFPHIPVRAAIGNWKDEEMWPHIEYDGILCLLPNLSTYEVNNPAKVTIGLLSMATSLIEDLIKGKIGVEVFRNEFLTYWMYGTKNNKKFVVSLFEPREETRILEYVYIKERIYVAENSTELRDWIRNRFGNKIETKISNSIGKCGLIWLEQVPLPNQYPQTAADVMTLAKTQGHKEKQILNEISRQNKKNLLCLFAAKGQGGPGLMPVHIFRPKIPGFRICNTPDKIIESHIFNSKKVLRTQVVRADTAWIHGRGKDTRSTLVSQKSVTIFGCGSIGSFLAENLSRMGIGKLNIVDFDELVWANVGRHSLGASSVGKVKSVELAKKLSCEMPHLTIRGYNKSGIKSILSSSEELVEVDLVVSATGDWTFENQLNKWHISQGRKKSVVYGWTEKHAIAGSAVVISKNEGCLACGLNSIGNPNDPVVEWVDEQELITEPSCSDRFQPYSAIELMYITSMISETILYQLLNPSTCSFRMVWMPSKKKLIEFNGNLNPTIKTQLGSTPINSGQLELPWLKNEKCYCDNALIS